MADADAAAPTDEERERLAGALRRHVADGRLDLAEFEVRVARVYGAATRAAARAALDGLPPLDASPSRPAARRKRTRHGEAVRIEPHWVATGEVFRDPSSGRVMRVWVDPTDGSRHYGQADGH
ncbi:DUF1707 SHOCT-like domain-containing protein [Pseudonocardia humida]|uniref:DUF1707 domain-containing protein n=1 Tax=Pseudonocardia humida TaxID=2800819 RepID=A0ABT1ADG8_9PSEU|nr:DUF1707 domain-containing protein [Pseudonocardia humida]MCO1661120.1 DUF1707 domain-containing protein [Pseudonocardia humida]